MSRAPLDAPAVARLLDLQPHPEGGHYRETFRDPRADASGRAASTAIYYLLGVGETSEWHRVDAAEVWHFYAGAPLVITMSPNGHDAESHHLGPDLAGGQRPQLVVPAEPAPGRSCAIAGAGRSPAARAMTQQVSDNWLFIEPLL